MDKKYLTTGTAKYLLFVTLIIGLIQAQAQGQEAKGIELEKIIVTNRRAQVPLSESSENVTVIDEDEIKQLPARDLSEVLKYITGVDIEPRQGFGRPTAISIQGSDSRHVRLMIDGIPLNSQSSGQTNPAVFPIESIARIEVIKGAASSVWGSSLGGVINVITKDTGKTLIPKGSFTTSFAELHTKKESGELSGKVGDLGYYLFSSYMESGGKGWRDDVLEKKGFGKLSYDLKEKGKITGSFGYTGADVNSGEFPNGTWQAEYDHIRYGKVGWEGSFDDTDIKVDFKHSRQEIITKFYNSIVDEDPSDRVYVRDLLYQLSLNSGTRLREDDLLVLGTDFDWDTLKSTYLFKAKAVKLQAPYVNYTLKLNPWDWNFGLRYDHNNEFGEQLSPSLGLVYKLKNAPDTLIRATVSRAFNAPTLLWKYYEKDLSGLTTNPDIKPERAWVYELGLESKLTSKLWVKFSLYRADVWDAIDMVLDEGGKNYMKNFEKFKRQGAELQFRVNVYEGLNFYTSGEFNDIEDRATKKTVKGNGKPRQRFDLGIEYKNKRGFSLSLLGYYYYWNEPASSRAKDRKMLCDLKASQEFKNFSPFFNIYNLTNRKYWRDYFFPTPERYFEGGFTIKW